MYLYPHNNIPGLWFRKTRSCICPAIIRNFTAIYIRRICSRRCPVFILKISPVNSIPEWQASKFLKAWINYKVGNRKHIRHSPVINAESGIKRRGPNLSTSPPRTMLEAPPAREREVLSQPKIPREIPRSLPMGIMNKPRLRVPVAAVAKFTTNRVATIVQP